MRDFGRSVRYELFSSVQDSEMIRYTGSGRFGPFNSDVIDFMLLDSHF